MDSYCSVHVAIRLVWRLMRQRALDIGSGIMGPYLEEIFFMTDLLGAALLPADVESCNRCF